MSKRKSRAAKRGTELGRQGFLQGRCTDRRGLEKSAREHMR